MLCATVPTKPYVSAVLSGMPWSRLRQKSSQLSDKAIIDMEKFIVCMSTRYIQSTLLKHH